MHPYFLNILDLIEILKLFVNKLHRIFGYGGWDEIFLSEWNT